MEQPDRDRLDELCCRHEIEQVISSLARATDRRDPEAIRSCYHADAFDDHGAFQGSPAEFAEWVPKALAPFAATQHFLAPPRIERDGDIAHCETYCTAHHVFPPSDPGGERDSVMGRVKSTASGRTTPFTMPSSSAAATSVPVPSMRMPGTIC